MPHLKNISDVLISLQFSKFSISNVTVPSRDSEQLRNFENYGDGCSGCFHNLQVLIEPS